MTPTSEERREVELPQSADGKIWTGREACFWTDATEAGWHRFEGLVYIYGKWYVEDGNCERFRAASVWYECPDSFERIAREMDEWRFERMRDLDEGDFDDLGLFAERIRKLAEKEASDGDQ